jgi:hypothetical protein
MTLFDFEAGLRPQAESMPLEDQKKKILLRKRRLLVAVFQLLISAVLALYTLNLTMIYPPIPSHLLVFSFGR